MDNNAQHVDLDQQNSLLSTLFTQRTGHQPCQTSAPVAVCNNGSISSTQLPNREGWIAKKPCERLYVEYVVMCMNAVISRMKYTENSELICNICKKGKEKSFLSASSGASTIIGPMRTGVGFLNLIKEEIDLPLHAKHICRLAFLDFLI